jgi:muconolactone delta-isomerase
MSEDGMRTTYHEQDGKIILDYSQDIEATLKANHEQRAMSSRLARKGDMHHVMRVPRVILMKICEEHHLNFFEPDDAKKVLEILKRPEFAAFRVYDGQI